MSKEMLVPLIVGLTSAPVFVFAWLVGRGRLHLVSGLDARRVEDPAGLARRLSLLLWLVALAMLGAAAGFYWAGTHEARASAVVVALVVAVNVLGVVLLLTVAKARHGYREPPKRR